MQSLRVTLYEIFGYLAPGLIAMAAFAIAMWAIYQPAIPLSPSVLRVRPLFLGCIAFSAYMVGHLLQAISNLHPSAEKRRSLVIQCDHLRVIAAKALYQKYQVAEGCESLADVVTLAYAILSQNGKTEAYDIFVYREGFYRAGYLSYVLLSVALILRALPPTLFAFHGLTYLIPRSAVLVFSAYCILSACFFLRRFLRFGEYRIRYVLGVVCVGPTINQNDVPTEKE